MRKESLLVLLCIVALLAVVEAFSSSLAATHMRSRRGGAVRMQVKAAPTFTLSTEKLEPAQTELQRSWFQAWGFAEPEPPKDASGAGMGMGSAAKGKGGKAKAGPPKATSSAKLYCKAPSGDLVSVYRVASESDASNMSPEELAQLGEAARKVVEEAIPKTGAVLLRGLPMRTAEAFSHFWKGHLAFPPALEEGRYNSLGPSGGRDKMSGIDLATNVPPQFLLLCHNEMCYNPKTIARIALYCIQDAREGGETIIARNSDLNRNLPPSAITFLKEHGGIKYQREFYDARSPPPATLSGGGAKGSWQEKCSLPKEAGRDEAEAFFKNMGFTTGDMEWDDTGALKLSNSHPGFVADAQTGEQVWWNIIHTGSLKAGDGTPFPKKMVQEVQKNGWEHTYAFKLKPGDWLMCDNLRVQHGRLPFSADAPKRVLLTVYSTPIDSCTLK